MTTNEYYQRKATVKANMETMGNYALDADWLNFLTDNLLGIGAQIRQNSGGIRIFWERARAMDINTLAREHYNGTSFFCALFTSPELRGRFTVKDFWSEIIEPGKLVNGLTQDEFYQLFVSDKLTNFIRRKYKSSPSPSDNNNLEEKKRIQDVFDEKALADMRVKAEEHASQMLPILKKEIIESETRKIREEVMSPMNLKRLREEATEKVTLELEEEIRANLMQDYMGIKDRVLAKLEEEIRKDYEGPLKTKIVKPNPTSNSNSLFKYDDEITQLHSLKSLWMYVNGENQMEIINIVLTPFANNNFQKISLLPGIREILAYSPEIKGLQGNNQIYGLINAIASASKRVKIDVLIEALKICD